MATEKKPIELRNIYKEIDEAVTQYYRNHPRNIRSEEEVKSQAATSQDQLRVA